MAAMTTMLEDAKLVVPKVALYFTVLLCAAALGGELAPLSLLSGFAFYDTVSAPTAGQPNRLDGLVRRHIWSAFPGFSLRVPLPGGWRVHLHHWLYLSLGIVVLLAVAEPSHARSRTMWLMVGGALQVNCPSHACQCARISYGTLTLCPPCIFSLTRIIKGIYRYPKDCFHVFNPP